MHPFALLLWLMDGGVYTPPTPPAPGTGIGKVRWRLDPKYNFQVRLTPGDG